MKIYQQRPNLDIPITSLLWPEARPVPRSSGTPWEIDIGLNDLITALTSAPRYTDFMRKTLTELVTDAATIAWRQSVLADFVRNPSLSETAENLLPKLAHLREGNALFGKRQRNLLLDTADHLAELDSYVQITQTLHTALNTADLQSTPLSRLRDDLARLQADPNFQALCADLPGLREPLERIASITVGINLDVELRPLSATLLAINDTKFTGAASWIEKVLGAGEGETVGITQLHRLPEDMEQRVLFPLFQDLDRILTQIAQPVAKALNRYVKMGTSSLAHMEYELAFFTAAARLQAAFQNNGVVCCWPQVAPPDERIIEIEGLANVALARRSAPITSDINFDDQGRIAVLTGPNSGGKTTYLRSVGLAQVMFQAGLFVPAKSARISPVDYILTHFPGLETRQEGRLAEEAARLRQIFTQATPHSLVLLNETFSSTSSSEGIYLAQDILCGLRAIGLRAIFATHLTELAERLPEMETTVTGESRLFSLVAGVTLDDEGQAAPTYRIERGLPSGRSTAREIARRHGISLEQILTKRQPEA